MADVSSIHLESYILIFRAIPACLGSAPLGIRWGLGGGGRYPKNGLTEVENTPTVGSYGLCTS